MTSHRAADGMNITSNGCSTPYRHAALVEHMSQSFLAVGGWQLQFGMDRSPDVHGVYAIVNGLHYRPPAQICDDEI
jgi:hypothetical protein